MGKYFGTDGVRGVANQELTPELVFKLGRFGGYVLTQHSDTKHPRVLVGRDTRISGVLLEQALIAGLISVGCEVMRLGVISTPGVAYLTRVQDAAASIMISASHNPVQDNGIKFFGPDGFKLSDEAEFEIEALLDQTEDTLPRPSDDGLGSVEDFYEGSAKYLQYLRSCASEEFTGVKVAIDMANGATSQLANRLFADLDADIFTMASTPDGLNINDGVGSTHPEALARFVVDNEADVGVAFDGDGDRIIAVDEKGNIVDGDQLMFIIGNYLSEKGLLKNNTVVSTVMSNLGFHRGLEEAGINDVMTQVGDRYVVAEMRKNNFNFGGEQSGHIVLLDHNTTGDGMLVAVKLVDILKQSGKKMSELAEQMDKYPQKLVNVRVTDKHHVTDNQTVAAVIAEVEALMGDKGRVLVRPSGTEPLVRVMVEAASEEDCENYCDKIVAVVQTEMGL
ncbi:phosphoglucosamine mutase [Brochothrix thermosphacta]|uniref:phosphoglucosamine mutase n=1 Tax=Brochothrix thermosphacta TaxID=2756 RepID=UPI00083F9F63|nr:phosphoglucosamine mutase [Brochothrix thermosphacta]ANZ98365.1 phosphoglucosamine mutase [Brochothrix thermosphacta]ODJ63120.1 phosphoglucosamine mutase [Brochothrix thermosphacta]ODJ66968.1 phosphoglucosamine mutase [Brochothrix thermosphacta]SPN72697.1 phosphoglucosamine mutase [Brochothrix thermosphacta]HCZ39067.1 phosphoglucosamine mutase [Brochothrix thermosphacta]